VRCYELKKADFANDKLLKAEFPARSPEFVQQFWKAFKTLTLRETLIFHAFKYKKKNIFSDILTVYTDKQALDTEKYKTTLCKLLDFNKRLSSQMKIDKN
jgi:hypothetical protein